MKVVCLFFLLLFIALPLAQAGEIHGRVLNQDGDAVPAARVTVEREDGQFHHEVRAEAGGVYQIEGLGQGIYSVTVSGPSGRPSLRREVVVGTPDSSVQLDFRLPQVAEQAAAEQDEGNPNIFVYRMDLNVLRKRLTIVRGADTQSIQEFQPEQNYFGSEFGAPLREFTPLGSRPVASLWHSSLSGYFENSVLNARSFFNVGPLRPSRSNEFVVTSGGPLASEKLSVLARYGRLHRSGEVNGNVQVPKNAAERVPLSGDPQVSAIVSSLLQAYPTDLPNLPHVTIRQLNTNAPQEIDSTEGLLRLDYIPKENTSAAFRYTINDYAEDPFELVIGKNPQTDLRSQGVHTSLTRAFSPNTLGRIGFHYDRSKALLQPTDQFTELFQSLGLSTVPDVDFRGDSFQDLGPGKQFPRFRVRNQFHVFGDLSKTAGRHTLKMGWGTARIQVNDLQSDNSRGTLIFATDFGNSEVENFLLGRPSRLRKTLGNLYRGFRNWEHFLYIGDRIRLTPTLQLSLGLRYELATAPTEVNGLTDVGYSTDWTNFAPRFGLAWNPGRGSTTVRAAYGISYGSVFPVTYQQARFNPPAVQVVVSSASDDLVTALTNPLQFAEEQQRSALNRLSPDLVTPYSHQYTLTVERSLPGSFSVRLAYIGMRSFHLFFQNVTNRARPCNSIVTNNSGEPCNNTTSNTDARRLDPRFSSITNIESGSNSYYDAAQVSLEKRLSQGLMFRATYTFGKNIDHGGDFTNTASGVENPQEVGNPTSELTSRVDGLKGWSLFDTPHALSISYSYALPFAGAATGWKGLLLSDWEVSGTTIFQSGTPFHFHTGSDAPGFGNVDGERQDRPNLRDPSILGISVDDPDTAASVVGVDTCIRPNQRGPDGELLLGPDGKPPQYMVCKYFDTNIEPGGRGNLGYNLFRKDGTNNWNFSIGKTVRFQGRREKVLQFRAAFLNLFNHAQFEKPGVSMASPRFGLLTNTVNKGRVVQLSLRLNF